MPLINPAPTPLVLTDIQKLQRAKTIIINRNTILFNQMVSTFNDLMVYIWQNPMGLTPQQVLGTLGTDAGAYVANAEALKTFINTIVPGTITAAAPAPITVNSDGTVTVG